MISVIPTPLDLPPHCAQVSCHFDKDAYGEHLHLQYGIALPQAMHKAIGKRKAEFLAGRYCARRAMEKLGASRLDPGVGIGEKRAPIWPTGVTGSITHSKGYACAAVAQTRYVRAVGIDSEKLIVERTANNVAHHILTPDETHEANRALVDGPRQYLTLVFSAKESIFKCLYPLVEQYFDFRDAQVFPDREEPGHFRFRLLRDLSKEFHAGYEGRGRYALQDEFVHTAVVLQRET